MSPVQFLFSLCKWRKPDKGTTQFSTNTPVPLPWALDLILRWQHSARFLFNKSSIWHCQTPSWQFSFNDSTQRSQSPQSWPTQTLSHRKSENCFLFWKGASSHPAQRYPGGMERNHVWAGTPAEPFQSYGTSCRNPFKCPSHGCQPHLVYCSPFDWKWQRMFCFASDWLQPQQDLFFFLHGTCVPPSCWTWAKH